MDGTTQQDVDLIDDIWRQIFTSLDCRRRPRLLQVCKRWQSILSNPVSWLELDVKFLKESTTESDAVSFKQFVSKYCYQASKVNIEVANTPNWVPVFQAVLPLTQLRYLRFMLGGNVQDNASEVHWETPKWSNLVYLNLGSASRVMFENTVLERILQAAPNLEELYLHRYFLMSVPGWTSIFKPLQKLKSLSILEIAITRLHGAFGGPQQLTTHPEFITEHLPHLQVLYLYRHERSTDADNGGGGYGFGFGQAQPSAPICQQYGNTLVVSTDLMKSRDLEMMKRIGPLLKETNYAHYFTAPRRQPNAPAQPFEPELLDYLFKDLKLDINCNTIDMRNNRPFTSELFVEPIGLFLHPDVCPLSSAIESIDTVRKMLDLGADPNMPHESLSPFSMFRVTKEVCLLLLERGADPLKKVHGQAALAFLFNAKHVQDDDMAEIMTVILQKGVDANSVLSDNGATLLGLAVQYEYEETARVLVAHGARLTATSMDQLITWNQQWWTELIESGAFDVNKLHLSTVLRAVKVGLFPLVRGYLQNITQDLDVTGYNLAHYASVLPLLNISPKKKDTSNTNTRSLGDGTAVFTVAPGWPGGPMFQPADPPMFALPPPMFANANTQPPPMFSNADTQPSPPKKDTSNTNAFSLGDGAAVFTVAPGSTLFGGATLQFGGQSTFGQPSPMLSSKKVTPMEIESESSNSELLIQLVKELDLDVNVKSATGQTPLLLVCSHSTEDDSVVTTLIECGARVNEPDSNGWTPLHAALYLHKYDTVKVLLSRGANMNAQDKLGVTPVTGFISSLGWARKDDKAMWDYLLSLGIDVNITDKYMLRNVLHYVCISRHVDLLTALLKKIPSININCPDAHGFTPLHYAAIGLEEEMMKMLVGHGADTNAVTYTLRLTPMSALIAAATTVSPYYRYVKSYNSMSGTAPVNLTTSIGPEEHPLEIISIKVPSWLSDGEPERGRSKKVDDSREYLPLPTDLSIKDQFGNNILHDIVRSTDYLRHFLNKHHMFPSAINELWSIQNKFGTTPFHIFAKHTFYSPMYQIDVAEETLLKVLDQPHVVDSLNSKDEHGRTGLEYLFEHKSHRPSMSSRITSALYKMKGLKFVSSRVESLSSLPHIAIENNSLDCLVLFKIGESDPESLNLKVNGKTPLMLFIEKLFTSDYNPHLPVDVSWVNIIDAFLELEVDLNAQDNQGNTALHHACFFFHLGGWNCPLMHDSHLFSFIVFKLLDAGALVDIANKSGQTVLDIVPNLLELDRSLVQQVKVKAIKTLKETFGKKLKFAKSTTQHFYS